VTDPLYANDPDPDPSRPPREQHPRDAAGGGVARRPPQSLIPETDGEAGTPADAGGQKNVPWRNPASWRQRALETAPEEPAAAQPATAGAAQPATASPIPGAAATWSRPPAAWPPAPAAGHPRWPAAGGPTEAHHPSGASRGGFLGLLLGGLRAILLMPVRPGTVNPGAGSCLVLVALITALGIGGEWWLAAEAGDTFNWSALRSAWFDLPLIVLGGAWLAQPRGPGLWRRRRLPVISAPPTPLLHFAAVVLSASAWLVALAYGVMAALAHDLLPQAQTATLGSWIYLAVPVWAYLVAARTIVTMHRAAPIGLWRRFLVLFLLAASTAWSLLDPLDPYWEPSGPGEPVNYVASEEILALQDQLLGAHLARIQYQRPAIVDLYFIGFAPYASEDVFRKELEVIHPLMDQRFDTAGRSLRLVSNAGTLRDYPIATVTHLRRALMAVAERMDRQQDVLVLYLTTHGSRNAVLATDMPPLRLFNIDPPTLKRLLDEAGIRNRVLIISACYSGTFIAPLQSPDTLIITASTADRPSFGCGNDSDFTYFGDALFNQALRQTRSFEQGYALALPTIEQREQAQGFQPSRPQMSQGEAIRERLSAVEKRLSSLPR
jgi:hypothetical protein